MTHTIDIPGVFWDDYCERHSPQDVEDVKRGRLYRVVMSDDRLNDVLQDALYYAEGWPDDAPRAVIMSARATVVRIGKVI